MVFQRSFYPQRRWPKRPERSLLKEKHDVKTSPKDLPKLNFSTWNVEGKGSPEDIDKLLVGGTDKSCPDIVCLQEANLPSAGEDTANYKWMCAGVYGSAILLNKKAPLKCTVFDRICDQICVAELSAYDVTFKIISCYIPPSTDYVSVDLWTKLQETLNTFPSNQLFMLAGDFNAEIGSDDRALSSVGTVGPALLHKVSNDHGVKLLGLARSGHYKITSTYFNRVFVIKDHYTYKDGEDKRQRAYILIPFSQFIFMFNGPSNEWRTGYRHSIHSNNFAIKESIKMEHLLMVNTWNIQGVSPTKVDTILTEQNLSVVCVQGLFLTSEDDIQTENFTWHCSKKLWAKNVGIVVKKSDDMSVENFEVVSEFLCSLDLTVQSETTKLICCYLPVNSDPNHDVVAKQLSDLVKGLGQEKRFILAGDFSTRMNKYDKKEDDENTKFLSELVAETKLCCKNSLWNFWEKRRNFFVSYISESDRGSPHHLLMPQEWRSKVDVKIFATWIPTFENAIVSMVLSANSPEKVKAEVPLIKPLNTISKSMTEISEVVNGEVRRTKIYELTEFNSDEDEQTSKTEADKDTDIKDKEEARSLSAEDVEKFKDTPPSVEDLKRMLPGFTIFYKPNKWSSALIQNPSNLLVTSFRENNSGKVTFEEIIISDEKTAKKKKIMCSIKWKGILLEKANSPGTERNGIVRKEAVVKLLNKLAQFAYTVKGKRSFYNKGAPPVLMGDEKLEGYFKLVEKEKVPTKEDVLKHIDDFFSANDSYGDLVFGPGFSEEELADIKKHASSKQLCHRFIVQDKDGKKTKFIAVFKRFSPQEIKDRLMKEKEDPKFFLVPPAEKLDTSYVQYLSKYESEHFKSEFRYLKPNSSATATATATAKKSKTTTLSNGTKKKQTNRSTAFASRRNINIRKPTYKVEPWLSNAPQAFSSRNTRDEWSMQLDRGASSSTNFNKRDEWRMQLDRGDMEQGYRDESRSSHIANLFMNRDMKRGYRDESRSTHIDNLFMDRDMEQGYRDESRSTQIENLYLDRDGNYSKRPTWNESRRDDYYDDQDGNYSKRPTWNESRRDDYYDDQEPLSKRGRLTQDDDVVRVNKPDWARLAPLVIVWPITVQSRTEDRPRQVLEDNFPVDYVRAQGNKLAVVVSLPMRDGTEKKFCLSMADTQQKAAEMALREIVKHSTTIKPNPTYLCDGATPNFVRYRVPCQTNPRTYIIVGRADTGPLTQESLREILETFRSSFNEDVFFDKDEYSFNEKMLLMEEAPNYNLKVRHFGDKNGVVNHYVCVYKTKPKMEIVEEVLKMKNYHPKFIMTTNRLPARMNFNIY